MKAFIDANLLIYLNTVKNKVVRAGYERLYFDVLRSYKLVTNVLVLDETVFVSWKKYNVPYKVTLSFIEGAVLPYVEILPLREEEYVEAAKIIRKHGLKPSDALHAAAMLLNNVKVVVSEDDDFDKISGLKRIWI